VDPREKSPFPGKEAVAWRVGRSVKLVTFRRGPSRELLGEFLELAAPQLLESLTVVVSSSGCTANE
jgi:hypothetical protein